MRILHVNKFLYRRGGAEAYMFDLAAMQRRAGHEVTFFGMHHPNNSSYPFAWTFPPQVDLESPPAAWGARISSAGRMIHSPSSRRGMARILEAFQPDVVHLHNIYHQLSPSILRPVSESGTPAVMTLHDYKLACPSYLMLDHGSVCDACLDGNPLHAAVRRCKDDSLASSSILAVESTIHRATGAYGTVRAFVCPSRFCAAVMSRAGVYPERLRVLGNFIDSGALQAKHHPGGGLVYVGRLSHEKGVDTLLEALALVPAATLDVIGEGPLEQPLRRLAEDRAPGRVRFRGHLSRQGVLELLRRAAVAVVPSRCHENQPIAVLEAFACGLPVVATDRGGLPERIAPGRDGDIVPAGDPPALAGALEKLLGDPRRAFDMGRAARARVQRECSPESHLRRLEEIYAETSARTLR